jgi:hypothetical protein
MDNFDLDSLDKYIRKYKRNIVSKFENVIFTENEMRNQSDLLCMVLEYSPRLTDERRIFGNIITYLEKFRIKQPIVQEDCKTNGRSLVLEKQNAESSSDDEKEGTIKLSRFSSRIQKESSNDSMDPGKANIVNTKVKEILYDIIEEALIKLPIEEEEDEYFKQIESRHNRIYKVQATKESNSKFTNKFSENMKIRIYLLNSQNYYDLNISYNDTFRDVKTKVLAYIFSTNKFKVKYNTVDGKINLIPAFEIRLIDDDEDDGVVVNMEINVFDDKALVVKTKIDTFAMVEKISYDPEKEGKSVPSILGTSLVNNSEVK